MTAAPATARGESIRPLILAWLIACAILTVANLTAIAQMEFPDPDDTLRLLEVRDWLAGQGWADLHQYRMNPPEGAPMHWSRLVDLPIAAIILLLRPLFGQAIAETAALVIVPLLTLGVVMALVALVARRLLDRENAILATFLVPVPGIVAFQLKPMRIDHHGWQMALGMGILLALLDPNRRRSGIVAGTLAAIWLTISLEGLPFAVALVGLIAIRWLLDRDEGERLVAAMAALFGMCLLLFASTRDPATWATAFCDSLSAPHLAVLALGAAGTAAIVRFGPPGLPWKLACLGFLAAAAAGLMLAIAPQCAAGPFETLDPLVYKLWYLNVHEGLPVWYQMPEQAALNLSFPVVGLIGSGLCFFRAEGERRLAWGTALFLLAAAFVTALFVQRAASVANLFAIPGGVFLFRTALSRARALPSMPLRLGAMAAALALVAPGHAIFLGQKLGGGEAKASSRDVPVRCLGRDELEALNRLPVSDIATPLDIGPQIIALTHHRIIASGHHRNARAMRDALTIFLAQPSVSRDIMARRSIEYMVVCPGLPETRIYKLHSPNGLWAQLEAGRTPEWLEPVTLPGVDRLKIWRVRYES